MTFDLVRLGLDFRAAGSLYFPPDKAGNVLRGALGMVLRDAIFAPSSAASGPSGFADAPRPFVLRAAHLDGCRIPPGSEFHFDVHLFDATGALSPVFVEAFTRLAEQGLGPTRARAVLLSASEAHVSIDLDPPLDPATAVRVEFVTPTELKSEEQLVTRPEFAILFARLRDRISTLRALYGPGPLEIDFRAAGERAAQVHLADCDLRWHETERRSRRTGQVHALGGFTGWAYYTGGIGEFLPYLRAGQFTGVGRQTVWGKGEIHTLIVASARDSETQPQPPVPGP